MAIASELTLYEALVLPLKLELREVANEYELLPDHVRAIWLDAQFTFTSARELLNKQVRPWKYREESR